MKVYRYALLPMTCLVFLAACTDDSSTPTPAPSATPTPTPTPAASAYQPVADFARDRSFSGLIIADTTQTLPASVVYRNPDATTLTYTAATQTFVGFDHIITPGTNNAALVQTDDTLAYSYQIGTSASSLTIYRKLGGATYVGYVRNYETVPTVPRSDFALIGAPTLASDLPLTGTTTYQVTTAELGAAAAAQTLVFDAVARTISGTVAITLTGTSAPITVAFQGTLDPQSGRVEGTVKTADGAYAGALHGRLYGPAATEIGLIFDLKDANAKDLLGILVGHK